MNIFEIQQSKEDRKFLRENIELEFDVAADIADKAFELPYLGSLFKLCRVALNIRDWHFVQKLAKYLKQIEDIDESKREEFIRSLSPEDNQRISKFMINLLYNAEEDRKAEVLGIIYKARLLGEIDTNMMLRLCSIVNKSYLDDLYELPKYIKDSTEESIAANNFISWGLIDSFVGGYWVNEPSYELNAIGKTLHRILAKHNWF